MLDPPTRDQERARGARDTSQEQASRSPEFERPRGSANGCRPLRGLDPFFLIDPGACAPGFTLSCAPRTDLTQTEPAPKSPDRLLLEAPLVIICMLDHSRNRTPETAPCVA
jgi:hypothetical protein